MKTTGLNSWKSWGITVICSFVNLISILPVRLAGLVFVALTERYNISRKTAAQPLVLAIIVRCISGPLVGYLSGVFECRTIIICGSILSFLGVGACFFAEEISYVILSLGLIYGVGMAFGHLLIPTVIRQHFDHHVSRANGVAFIGFSLGAIVVPPFFEYLLIEYGTPGAFLIISGVMLNGLPAAMLLKNPHYARMPQTKKEPKICLSSNETPERASTIHEMEALVTHVTLANFTHNTSGVCHSTKKLSSLTHHSIVSDPLDLNGSSENGKYTNSVNDAVYKDCEENIGLKYENEVRNVDEKGQLNLPQLKLPCNEVNERKALCPSFKVFKDPSYWIILFSNGVQNFLMATVWTIVVDLSRDKGIPASQEVYFLMLLPVTGLLGTVGLTWVTDGGYLSSWKFSVACYVCIAVSCGGLVWSNDFVTMTIALLSFSFFVSSMSTIAPALIYEFINEKENTMAMASRFVFFFPLGLTMPPLIGYFRENRGSYDWMLYLLAIISLFCSFLYMLMPYTVVYKERKRKSLR